MTKHDQLAARWFAELANYPDDLPPPERKRRELANAMTQIPVVRAAIERERQPRQKHVVVALQYFDTTHSEVRRLLPDLLDGHAVVWPLSSGPEVLKDIGGRLVDVRQNPAVAALECLRLLYDRGAFRRCRGCGTIFARHGRQLFCSSPCKDRWLATIHKKERRAYMRQLMADRRAAKH